MLTSGLVSISFRKKTPEEIIDLCVRAALQAIEWGGDVHVPAGDTLRAREVLARTRDAGLSVCSYGSYYRLGQPETAFFQALDCASALETPVMRIWAGPKGSRETGPSERARLIEQLAWADRAATERGVRLTLEYHGGTLTDSRESVRQLLEEIRPLNCGLYWQPRWDWSEEERLVSLQEAEERLSHLHVFTWTPHTERLPLEAGEGMWSKVFARNQGGRCALLEFVRDDADEQLLADAACLNRLLKGEKRA